MRPLVDGLWFTTNIYVGFLDISVTRKQMTQAIELVLTSYEVKYKLPLIKKYIIYHNVGWLNDKVILYFMDKKIQLITSTRFLAVINILFPVVFQFTRSILKLCCISLISTAFTTRLK